MLGRTNTGGGVSLNFKLIGNPKPSTAKENTIWVDTDKITGWYFSATKPENMQDWEVWFPTGTSSGMEFNALKKNGIQTYPLSAKQYLNGVLEDKSMSIYQNGTWNDGRIYIVKKGVITDIGLSGIARPAAITVTEKEGYLNIAETDGKTSGITTPEKINVDNISSLHASIDLKAYGTTSGSEKLHGVSISLLSDLDNSTTTDLANAIEYQTQTKTLGKQNLDLDLSTVSGSYYIGFVFASSSSQGKPDFDVYDFYME